MNEVIVIEGLGWQLLCKDETFIFNDVLHGEIFSGTPLEIVNYMKTYNLIDEQIYDDLIRSIELDAK